MATTGQYRAIFSMARACGIDEDILRDMLHVNFKKKSFKDISKDEAKDFIDILIKLHPSLKRRKSRKIKQYPNTMIRFITPAQTKLILDFARSMLWDESNINNLISSMFPKFKKLHDQIDAEVSFRRLSMKQAQSLIEAIKSIQERKLQGSEVST